MIIAFLSDQSAQNAISIIEHIHEEFPTEMNPLFAIQWIYNENWRGLGFIHIGIDNVPDKMISHQFIYYLYHFKGLSIFVKN